LLQSGTAKIDYFAVHTGVIGREKALFAPIFTLKARLWTRRFARLYRHWRLQP
jgi:hypothetical protein